VLATTKWPRLRAVDLKIAWFYVNIALLVFGDKVKDKGKEMSKFILHI